MNNTGVMGGCDCVRDFCTESHNFIDRERTIPLNALFEFLAIQQLHDQVGPGFVGTEVQDVNDARVADASSCPRFVLEASEHFVATGQGAQHPLDG